MNNILTRPVLHIDLKALCENYRLLKKAVTPAECAAVVKNNAYGLGAYEVVKALGKEGCRTFWVAHAHEGAEIRKSIPGAEIMVLHGPGTDTMEIFRDYNLTPVINSMEQFSFWEKHRKNNDQQFVLHLNSGLNRYGMQEQEAIILASHPEYTRHVKLLISHLACADETGHPLNLQQKKKFDELRRMFPGARSSLAASDGLFIEDGYHYDMVRAGAALYGINTTPYRQNQMRNVVSVDAPVLQVADLMDDQYIGYGASYKCTKKTRVATMAIGYADGIPRNFQDKGKVWFIDGNHHYAAPIVGRVSMDMITCDVTDVPEGLVYVGAMASLLNKNYTVDDMARDSGTIGYEILSRLGNRYERIYTDRGLVK